MRTEWVLLLQLTLFCVAFHSAHAQVMSFDQTTYSVSEGSGNITVTVYLIGGTVSGDEVVTVSTEPGGTATAGGDYTPVNTELTFNSTNADVPQNVTIFILDDLLLEDSEYFNVTLTRANSSTDSFTVIIEDDDRITIGFYCSGWYYVNENAGSVRVTVEIWRGTPARDVIVTLQTANSSAKAGVEYRAITTNLTFNVSNPIHVVTIPIIDDVIVENYYKYFYIPLTTNDPAVILSFQRASVQIYDNDRVTVGFNSTTYSASEGASGANLTVSVLNGALASDTTVYVVVTTSLTGGTATAAVDYNYTSTRLTFTAATTSRTVTIPIIDDDRVENCESITVTLTRYNNYYSNRVDISTPRATVSITDNDEATFGFNPTYSVSEDVGNVTVAVSLLSGILDRDLIVSLRTLDGTAVAGMDFEDTFTDLTFSPSSSTQTAMVSIFDDLVPENLFEYFSLILTSTDRAAILDPTTANVTIVDNMDTVTIGFNPVTYSELEEAGSVNVTVSILNGTLGRNLVVTVSTTSGGTATGYIDATLTFGAAISTQMATVYIFGDSVVENTEFINLTLSSRDAAAILNPATASVSVIDGDTVQVGFEYPSYLVAEDSGNVSVCATLTGQLARDVTVTLSTSDETAMAPDDYTFLMQELNFNDTVTRLCVNIIIASDSINEVAAEMFTVFLNSTDSAVVLGQSTTVTIVDSPTITTDPTSQQNVVPGARIMFTIEAIGSDLTYQWQWNKGNVTDGTNYNGTTMAILTVMNITEGDEGNFTCVVTNAVGSVISNAAELILLDRPKITQQPTNQLNLDPGSTALFTVTATTAVGALTYQWQRDGIDLLPQAGVTGTNTHTLTLTNVQLSDETNYTCVVTNARGSVISHPAQLTILDPPTIVTDPQDVFNVIPGHNVTFSVIAGGLRLAYTWQLEDGSVLPNNGRFIANDEMLTIQDVMLSDPSSYRCVVTNAVGNATSNSANFTLIDPPTITIPPQSTAADIGSNTEFMCTARGEGTLTFTWTTTAPVNLPSSVQTQFNPQDGSETNTLSLTNVGSNHGGVYACSVSNERGSTGLHQATLTIIEISDIPDRTVTLGRNTTFTCSATGPGDIFYHWNRTVFDRNGVLLEIGFYNDSRVTVEDSSTLTVVDVGVSDEGHYTCFVSFNGTDAGESTAILSTRGPTILEQPLSINLLLLSNLTLKCSAQNNADAPNELEFYWYQNGHSVIPSSRIMIDSTGENATRVASSELVVMQVDDSDSGEYQCTVTNRDVVDGVNATADVTVTFTPVLWFLSGMIRKDATTSLRLECIVEAVPPVSFFEIRRRSQEGNVQVLSSAPGSSRRLTLQHTLQNLMVNDSAVYICVANNSVGLKKQNFTLVVQAPPDEVNHTMVTRELLTLQSVRLTWVQPEDNNAHINSYNITYCASVNYSCVQLTQTQTVLSTQSILQLIPVTTYQVYIRAENDVGQGPEPKEPYFLNSTTRVDAQPVGLNVAFVTATSVVLVWQLPTIAESAGVNSFILSYNLHGEESGGNTTHTGQPSRDDITRTVSHQQGRTPGTAVSGLDSDTLYRFRVSVNYSDPMLLSAEATVTVRTNSLESNNGTDFSTNVQQNFIVVSWLSAGSEEFVMNYILVYNSVSRVDQQTTRGNITISSNQTSYNFTFPFLQSHSNYSFSVFADFGNGRITEIGAPIRTISQEAVPSPPVDLQVQNTFYTSLNLSWSASLKPNGNIIHYTVYYQPTSSKVESSIVVPGYTPGHIYALEGLSPNTMYNIRVTASTNGGEGEGARTTEITKFGVYPPEIVSVNPTSELDMYKMTIDSFHTTFGPLRHYKVVVVHGSNTTTNTKTDIPDNTLLPVSQSQTSYYVAAAIMVENFQSTFIIGDGHTYTLDNETFMNAPLNNDQEYTVFIRLYSDVDSSSFEDSIPQRFTTTSMTTSTTAPTTPPTTPSITAASTISVVVNTEIVYITVPVIIFFTIIILILCILLAVVEIKRRRLLRKRRSQDTATWPLSGGFCVLNLTAMNDRNNMEEENVSISEREEDEDKNV